jgi:hypothetical protein
MYFPACSYCLRSLEPPVDMAVRLAGYEAAPDLYAPALATRACRHCAVACTHLTLCLALPLATPPTHTHTHTHTHPYIHTYILSPPISHARGGEPLPVRPRERFPCAHCDDEVYCSDGCRQAAWADHHARLCVGRGDGAATHPLRLLADAWKYVYAHACVCVYVLVSGREGHGPVGPSKEA